MQEDSGKACCNLWAGSSVGDVRNVHKLMQAEVSFLL
jgi:hypothetical protein